MNKKSGKTKEELLRKISLLESKVSDLEKSGSRSTLWLENSPVCTKIVDPDLNLQFLSSAGIRELKIDDITAFYGKPYPFPFYPDSFKILMSENLNKAKETGETISQEAPVQDLEGNTIWYHSTIVPVYNDKEKLDYLLVVSLDITARKQTEEELEQSEATISNKLKAITNPEGDISTLELSDIIDTEVLQSMMEDFYQLTGMLGAVLDVSGKVLVAVGWQDICTKFHRCNPDTLKNCIESDTILTQGVPEGTFKSYRCKNNMWDIVTPIMIQGKHVGNVFMGQYFYQDEVPDLEFFRKKAKKYGFDEKEYLAALDRVPHFSKETVDVGMQFYSKLAGLISTLTFSSIQQSRMLAQQKLAEEDTKKNQSILQQAENISNQGAWEWAITQDEWTFSENWLRIHGCQLSGIKREELMTIAYPEDAPEIEKAFQDALSGVAPYNLEHRIVRQDDGKVRYVRAVGDFIFNNSGQRVKMYGITRDITEKRLAEKKIRTAEENLKNTFDLSPSIICKANLDTGYFIEANQAVTRILGYSLKEFTSTPSIEFIHPDDHQDSSAEVAEQLEGKEVTFFENRYLCKDGSYKWLAWHGTKADKHGIVTAIGSDISERKKAELEIVKAKEVAERNATELNRAQEITHIGSWYLDTVTNEVVWTEELFKMYGFDPSLPVPPYTEHQKLFTAESWEILSSSLEKTREIGIPYELELKTVRKDGSNGWMWVRGEAVFDEEDYTIGLWGAAQDITERKNIEIELQTAKQKAEESDRLKSAFLANMSHEIRTPMNGILGFVNLLNKPNLSKSKIGDYSAIIQKSGNRLLDTINDIIYISKIEAGEVVLSTSETSINTEIEELYTFFLPEASRKGLSLSIETSSSAEQLRVHTDSHKLNGILTNLIKNAIKYTDRGHITLGYFVKDDFIEFFVEDTGIGIPEDRLQAIFNRFEQADIEDSKALQGSGLGLAISKAYTNMLGGEIFAQSVVGKGSKFVFTIPYIKKAEKRVKKAVETIDTDRNHIKKLNLLIVEDDAISSELLKATLEGMFKEMIFAENGIDAIELCRDMPELDLVLMDIKMSKMDGYNATREIRKFNKDLIIIAQTSYALPGDKGKAIEAGCNSYITKPINTTLLFKTISELFD